MCVYACTSVCQLWWLLQKCLYTAITYDNKTGHQWFAMHSRGKGWQHQSFFVPVRAAHSLKSHHSPCKQLMLFTKLGTLTTFRIDITLIGAVAKLCSSTKLFECSVLNLCFFFFFFILLASLTMWLELTNLWIVAAHTCYSAASWPLTCISCNKCINLVAQ